MSILEVTLLCVLGAIVACGLAVLLVKADTAKEERRRAAAKLASVLSGVGMVQLPDFLVDYSVGDYSGMTKKVVDMTRLFLNGQVAVLEEFSRVFDSLLDAKLSTETGRAYVAAKLADAAKTSDVDVVQDAPKPGVL